MDRPVSGLKISDQQVVEIAKALSLSARVLIMDEPTTALAADDVQKLFAVIRALTAGGAGVVYISHKMDELFAIADEFTVLRDGKFVGHRAASETTPDELVRMMVGREITHLRAAGEGGDEREELLRVENLSSQARDARGRRRLNEINFTLRRGEILGVAGLMGAGRTELLESLFGAQPVTPETRVTVGGEPAALDSPRRAIKAGLAFVSEDRKGQGLVLGMDVSGNITLAQLKRFTRLGFVSEKGEREAAREWVEKLSIKTPGVSAPVVNLSGGNQQKIVLAKWLLAAPRVLLLDEPLAGAGPEETERLVGILRGLRGGYTILLVEHDMQAVMGLCDTITVLNFGRKLAEGNPAEVRGDPLVIEAYL
ncbi:MAG: sugar ABC transporter ATP-binding protein, partial [Pyrinomonadaceae bacterium]